MTPRLNPFILGPEAMNTLAYFACSDHPNPHIELAIVQLARARALQLAAGRYSDAPCRNILAKHPSLASKISCLENWYTSRAFSPRERAALLWVEDIIYAPADGVPEVSYECAAREFPPDELWALTVAIVYTCAWAQVAKAFRMTDTSLC